MPKTTKPAATEKPTDAATPGHHPTMASGAIPAECLFKGAPEIRILHKGDLYLLRITRNDKLILTK